MELSSSSEAGGSGRPFLSGRRYGMLSQMMRRKRKIREMIWRWLRVKLVRARVGSQGSAGTCSSVRSQLRNWGQRILYTSAQVVRERVKDFEAVTQK